MIRLDRTVPFVRAALEGAISEAATILQDAERRHGLRWLAVDENRPENNCETWYQLHLWPFLSETHMVLTGGDMQYSECSLLDTEGSDHFPTWRHWGEIVATWANRSWFPRPAGLGATKWYQAQRPWNYLDFYCCSYLDGVVEEYDLWRSAVWKVLAVTGGGREST
jgi:hypothetical protein